MMTGKELVTAQIEHQETDYIPYQLDFDLGSDTEARLDDYYGSTAWRSQISNSIYQLPLPSTGINLDLSGVDYYTDAYGSEWRLDRRPYSLQKPAIGEPNIDLIKFPNIDDIFDVGWESEANRLIMENRDEFVVAAYGFGLFERSWVLRGFENSLMDMVTNLDFYEELIARLTEHQLEIVDRLIKLPVDGLWFFDDWGYQQGVLMGAERWRKIFKPHYERLYKRVHEADKYVLTHCCGSIEEILPDAIEIGLDVYQSVQPEAKNNNPYDLKRRFGDKLCFWGGLGSQEMIPFGTPKEIRSEVQKLCKEMGKDGGYILGPAKEDPARNSNRKRCSRCRSVYRAIG